MDFKKGEIMDDPLLQQLAIYTPEQTLNPGYGNHYLFFVGRDDVHGILLHLIQQEKLGLKMNMFGYDDDELNNAILSLFKDPSVKVQISLDKSQAGGVHEKQIIAADEAKDPTDFSSSFCILESATGQISHTKGGVLVGQGIGFEGSTNWSASGEGTGISLKADVENPTGFKAQNNTLLVSTSPVFISRFSHQLDIEHQVGLANVKKGNI
jgi:hypothetical protein